MKINRKELFENCNDYGISGVYAITNKVTKERYIGSSNDIRKRWNDHIQTNTWKRYPNNPLYQAFQKYGVEGFTFTIVALATEEHLKEVEQSAMKMLNDEYNDRHAHLTDDEKQEYKKAYRKSEKSKAVQKAYRESERGKAAHKKYQDQTCIYNGRELTLNALTKRFYRLGITHPSKEAKKYLVI